MRPIEPLARAFLSGELSWVDLTVDEREVIHLLVMHREVERIAQAKRQKERHAA